VTRNSFGPVPATEVVTQNRRVVEAALRLFDLAILTLGHEEHLGDVVAGYGTDVDRAGLIQAASHAIHPATSVVIPR
jgi:hypothetical protein